MEILIMRGEAKIVVQSSSTNIVNVRSWSKVISSLKGKSLDAIHFIRRSD